LLAVRVAATEHERLERLGVDGLELYPLGVTENRFGVPAQGLEHVAPVHMGLGVFAIERYCPVEVCQRFGVPIQRLQLDLA